MAGSVGRVALGFLAAAVAVITAHEAITYGLSQVGLAGRAGWDVQPVPPWGSAAPP
jgi:hypothetical protein